GMLPLSVFLMMGGNSGSNFDSTNSDFSDIPVHRTNFVANNAVPAEEFIYASENTVNSVVHVTTKVVTTQFQRDPFYEFFYGPGAGGREFKQFGQGSGSGVIVSSDGYIV